MRWCAAAVTLMLAAGLWTAARPAAQAAAQFSGGVDLVEVYATVTDARGAVVGGLSAGDFEVYENGQRQRVEIFAAGEFPLTVALGIDRSWSMAGEPLRLAKLAAQTFLAELRPEDRSMVVAIDSRAEVVAPLTMPRDRQLGVVEALDPWSTTALHDAVIATLDRLADEVGRQALIVFSDGTDRYSHAAPGDAVARARRGRALIYPIALGGTRPPLMAELAVLTGGRSFLLPDATGLADTLRTIARELRTQYLIGYVPAAAGGRGQWRSIRVRATAADGRELRVRARDGYIRE